MNQAPKNALVSDFLTLLHDHFQQRVEYNIIEADSWRCEQFCN
jgi:hypothetical protein